MDNNKQTPTRAEYNRKRRAERTPEQVEAENEIRRKKRAERTPAQKEAEAEQRRKKRAERTPEQLDALNEQQRQSRANRTPEQIEAENEQQRLRRATRTPEQIESDRENEHQGWIRRNTSEFRDQVATRRRKKPLPSPYAARNPDNRPATHYLGRRNMPCQFCGALHFDAEKNYRGQFSSCCAAGSIQLPSRTDYPAKFQSWLTETSEEAKHVKLNIRKYNSALEQYNSFK